LENVEVFVLGADHAGRPILYWGGSAHKLPTIITFSKITGLVIWYPACEFPVQERRLPTDTILTIHCSFCMAGVEFMPMIAHKDGRFVCRDCAHTVRPGVSEYKCTCRPCLRLFRNRSSLTAEVIFFPVIPT
jgi:hypothetical protein